MRVLTVEPENIHQEAILAAVKVLKGSGIVCHGTETVYGLACYWNDIDAIHRIAEIKNRSPQQPNSIMIGQYDDLVRLTGWRSAALGNLVRSILPGPLTLLLPRKIELPLPYWNQFDHIAIRWPADPLCAALVDAAGAPLITTSANIHGMPAVADATELSPQIITAVGLVLDSGPCPDGIPSTIIRLDPERSNYEIIRKGPLTEEKFQGVFDQYFSRQ